MTIRDKEEINVSLMQYGKQGLVQLNYFNDYLQPNFLSSDMQTQRKALKLREREKRERSRERERERKREREREKVRERQTDRQTNMSRVLNVNNRFDHGGLLPRWTPSSNPGKGEN